MHAKRRQPEGCSTAQASEDRPRSLHVGARGPQEASGQVGRRRSIQAMKARSKFFDSMPWDHLVKAVEAHTDPGSTDCEPASAQRRLPSTPVGAPRPIRLARRRSAARPAPAPLPLSPHRAAASPVRLRGLRGLGVPGRLRRADHDLRRRGGHCGLPCRTPLLSHSDPSGRCSGRGRSRIPIAFSCLPCRHRTSTPPPARKMIFPTRTSRPNTRVVKGRTNPSSSMAHRQLLCPPWVRALRGRPRSARAAPARSPPAAMDDASRLGT